jgi:serine O-acetyltransferase
MVRDIRADFARHDRSPVHGGFWTLALYRLGVWSKGRRGPVGWAASKLYSLLKPVCETLTGVILERTTRIGRDLHIVHAGGIQIHPHAVIGDRVGLMHGVTLGTNMGDEAPVIGDDVFIGCGAAVLGRVRVGNGARIAANSLVISDVPAGAVAMGVPARIIPGAAGMKADGPPAARAASQPSPPPVATVLSVSLAPAAT